jgi:hypothetical protein
MVILYTYSTCWHMKSMFYECQQPRCTDEPDRWTRNLDNACGTCATVSPTAGEGPTMTPSGQCLRCLEVARTMCLYHNPFRHRPTLSKIPPSAPSATRKPNFTQIRAAAGKRCLMASSGTSERAARRGTSSTTRRVAPQLATTKAWCAPRLSQAVASIKHDHPHTTSRGSLRRPARTTPTSSSTSSEATT